MGRSRPSLGRWRPGGRSAPSMGRMAPSMGWTAHPMGWIAPEGGPSGPLMGRAAPVLGQTAPTPGPTCPLMGRSGPLMGPTCPHSGPSRRVVGPTGSNLRDRAPGEGRPSPFQGQRCRLQRRTCRDPPKSTATVAFQGVKCPAALSDRGSLHHKPWSCKPPDPAGESSGNFSPLEAYGFFPQAPVALPTECLRITPRLSRECVLPDSVNCRLRVKARFQTSCKRQGAASSEKQTLT
jgi:hypothetical protein